MSTVYDDIFLSDQERNQIDELRKVVDGTARFRAISALGGPHYIDGPHLDLFLRYEGDTLILQQRYSGRTLLTIKAPGLATADHLWEAAIETISLGLSQPRFHVNQDVLEAFLGFLEDLISLLPNSGKTSLGFTTRMPNQPPVCYNENTIAFSSLRSCHPLGTAPLGTLDDDAFRANLADYISAHDPVGLILRNPDGFDHLLPRPRLIHIHSRALTDHQAADTYRRHADNSWFTPFRPLIPCF